MIYGILTSKQHATKLVNYLNLYCKDIKYVISTSKYATSEFEFDVGICYGYSFLVDIESPENKNRVFYNFHPSPLPEYSDWGNYARGLHDLKIGKITKWGASLHLIDKGIDHGAVLRVIDVPLISMPVDIQELGDAVHYWMFQLCKQVLPLLKYKPKTKEELDKLC